MYPFPPQGLPNGPHGLPNDTPNGPHGFPRESNSQNTTAHGSDRRIVSSGTGDQTRSGVPGGKVAVIWVQCMRTVGTMCVCMGGGAALVIRKSNFPFIDAAAMKA